MLTDRYGLTVSTTSSAAHVRDCDLQLSMNPGAIPTFDEAIAADPDFALAYIGRPGSSNSMATSSPRASMALATALAPCLPAREASHVAFFDRLVAGRSSPRSGCVSTPGHTMPWCSAPRRPPTA
jgi:hypothetical protein